MAEARRHSFEQTGSLEQTGLWALRVSVVAVLIGSFLLAVLAPSWVVLAPLALLGVLGAALASARPSIYLAIALVGSAAIFGSQEGLQLLEVLYFAYLVLFLGTWYTWWLLSGSARLASTQDLLSALVILLGLGAGVALGVVFGAPLAGIRGDLVGFLPLLLYFPVREAVASSPRWADGVALTILGLGVFAAGSVLWEIYSTVTTATAAWEIVDVRVSGYEVPLLAGTLGTLGVLPFARAKRATALVFAISMALLGVLIVTKSRGYWIGWAIGVVTLVVTLPTPRRRTFLAWTVGGGSACVGAMLIVAGDLTFAFVEGVVNRFATLSTAFSTDISLINRYIETDALMNRVWANPILGHGLGTEYSYHNVLTDGQTEWSYAHNGFAGLWFKLGFWGLALFMVWWLNGAWNGLASSRRVSLRARERGYGIGVFATLIGILVTTSTSGIYFIDAPFVVVTLCVALAAGLRERADMSVVARCGG